MKSTLPILFLFLLLYSCGNKTLFESSKTIPNKIWTYNDVFSNSFTIKNDTAYYDLSFGITHNESYPFQNIYIKITDDFTGTLNTDTINIDLFDRSGIIKGKKQNNNYHLNTLLRKSFKFPKSKVYTIDIEQLTRIDSLKGIINLTFKTNYSDK